MDQIQALQWVQKNIHVFGGDPKKVTIFGQNSNKFSIKTSSSILLFNTCCMYSAVHSSMLDLKQTMTMTCNYFTHMLVVYVHIRWIVYTTG